MSQIIYMTDKMHDCILEMQNNKIQQLQIHFDDQVQNLKMQLACERSK